MIIKKEYKTQNSIKSTMIDNIDRIDDGVFENGTQFINIFKKGRQKDDDFETIEIVNMSLYVMTDSGKTIQIYRGK